MTIKRQTDYTYEDAAGNTFPLPFDPENEPAHVWISEDGHDAVLAFIVRDDTGLDDPFEAFDMGEFYQFNRDYVHHTTRPDFDAFRRIVREYPGRVFTVCTMGEGYAIDEGPFTVADTKGRKEGDAKTDGLIEDAAGYYIVPEDATNPAEYAKGELATYTAWCEGETYGIAIWVYRDAAGVCETGTAYDEPDRDGEVWGYYGYEDAAGQCKEAFDAAVKAVQS